MPNLIFNSIISIIIFFSSVGVLLIDSYISPKYIHIKNVISINNTKTDSPKSRNSLLIYTDKITYRSSCLGLSTFCNRRQKTKSRCIQTIAPSSISARFDHNADGIATATGWTAAGNGILALDLDKNGKIDSGKEIFGNHSVLSNGATAAHGYAALAELDSNNDGKVNALDKAFNELRVWIDANSDGISQASELRTLMSLDIQSLNLEHQENSKDFGNGNRLTHIGSYTKIDGTTGEMGDVEFASNSLYSRYTDTIELTPEQLKAPNLQGLALARFNQ